MDPSDGNDSLASVSDDHIIDPMMSTKPSRVLGAPESVSRVEKEKGGPHAPWTPILLESTGQTREEADFSEEPIIFSDKKASRDPVSLLSSTHQGPAIKDFALNQLQRKAGHVPVSSLFHDTSYRVRMDDTDDEDLEFISSHKRKKLAAAVTEKRGISLMYDAIFWDKGDYSFPYRTFRPKVQVANEVPPGVTPQGIIAERLHRIFKRIDISNVLEKLGVEYADLLPPPNYGEHNARFFQESMWRNRSRLAGTEKRAYIYGHPEAGDIKVVESDETGMANQSSGSESGSSDGSSDVEDHQNQYSGPDLLAAREAHVKTKSQFGFHFPLEYFDNEEFDIRSPEAWMSLRPNPKGGGKYPLPGKAYLPLPPDPTDPMISLAEITSEVLLDKSARLQGFRRWLTLQRTQRFEKLKEDRDLEEELDLSYLMPMGTTIKTLIKKSAAAIKLRLSGEAALLSAINGSMTALKLYAGENDGESDLDDSLSSDSLVRVSEDFLSQFSKGRLQVEEEPMFIPTRSQSILSDIWSDPDSLEYLFAPPKVEEELMGEEAREGDNAENLARLQESILILVANKAAQDYESMEVEGGSAGTSGSPDVDYYEFAGGSIIYDYNKMKRVHQYNWKWAEVAIFEYDPVERRYLVCSIYEPVIFAWVPKIYLCMDAEDPMVQATRIKDAIERRTTFENKLRYNLYCDCLPIDDAPGIPEPWMTRIEQQRFMSTPRIEKEEREVNLAKKEVNLDWDRCHMNILFDRDTDAHQKYYRTWIYDEDYYRIHIEPGSDAARFRSIVAQCDISGYAFNKYRLQQSSVLFSAEPCAAFSEILVSSVEARNRPIILTRQGKPAQLHVWMEEQLHQINETHEYMKVGWLNFVVDTITTHLKKIPHSCYNIDEREWNVYEMSKISNYLRLVKFLMRDTLRSMVMDSLAGYMEEIRELTETVDEAATEGVQSYDSLTYTPPLRTPTPMWILDLGLTRIGPSYNNFLKDFPVSLIEIIHTSVDISSGFPDILPLVMKNMLVGLTKPLLPVGKDEPQISAYVTEITDLMKKGLKPVDTYAQSYNYFMPVYHLNVDRFMEEWNSDEHGSKEIRATVDFHMRHYAEIEDEIPTQIDVGAIRINVEILRTELLNRKKLLYTSILDSFAKKLKNLILGVLKEYKEIELKLNSKADEIEEVMALRHYLAGVPAMISRNEELIQMVMRDYELFERFKYRIANEDVEAKWTALTGLRKMYKLADEAVARLGIEYKRLLHMQKVDLSKLSSSVDKTMDTLEGLSKYSDMEHFAEAKEMIREIDKKVKDLDEHCALVNRRQTLFGLPPVQKEPLARIVEQTHRYKSLWLTIGDWGKFVEDVYNKPMAELEMTSVNQIVTDSLKVIRKSLKYFQVEKNVKMLQLTKGVKRKLNVFRKIFPLVYTLTNPGLRPRHLKAISDICGFPITDDGKYSLNELTAKRVGLHVDEIAKVGEMATEELKIELEMNKLDEEAQQIQARLLMDRATGIESVILPKRADSHLEKTTHAVQEFQKSPYRLPFAVRLDAMEKKLRLATETLKEIKVMGPNWCELRPSFEGPEVAEKMPVEHKIFLKMNRIYRRIIRIIRVNTCVLDFASDRTLNASIIQFQELGRTVRGLLDERNKPQDSDSDDD